MKEEVKTKPFSLKYFIKETLQTVATALVITFIIYNFVSKPNQVRGESMEPNIKPNDMILTNQMKAILAKTNLGKKFNLDYKRGDIVILKLPGHEPYIKRIVAGPGDIVEIKNDHLVVNDNVVIENYLENSVITTPGDFLKEEEPKIVPDDHFVVMGDNRKRSLDSRYTSVGFIPKEYIIGPAALRILPLDKIGGIKTGQFEEIPIEDYEFDHTEEISIEQIENE
jgi:signal peptidase I